MNSIRTVFPRPLILVLWWIGMSVVTHWPDIEEFAPEPLLDLRYFDKAVHMSLYLGWALLWAWVLSSKGVRLSGRLLAVVFAGGALWAILDEATQVFVRRTPDIWDWSCDLTGLILAVVIIIVYRRRVARAGEQCGPGT